MGATNHDGYWGEIGERASTIVTVRERLTARSSALARLAQAIGRFLAHPAFFLAMVVAHLGWIGANTPWVPWEPIDPYPFAFLATVASVEAPFIALLVLMHERRLARLQEVREEVELRISIHLERQGSSILKIAEAVRRAVDGEERVDPELLQRLESELDPDALAQALDRRLGDEDRS